MVPPLDLSEEGVGSFIYINIWNICNRQFPKRRVSLLYVVYMLIRFYIYAGYIKMIEINIICTVLTAADDT